MILSNQSIKRKLVDQALKIAPLTETQFQPASVDLRIGNHFLAIDETSVPYLSLEKSLNQELDGTVITRKSMQRNQLFSCFFTHIPFIFQLSDRNTLDS